MVLLKGQALVLIKGGGDLATGVAHRFYNAGFDVVITELEAPLVVRRTVSFAEAVYQGEVEIEGIKGILVKNYDEMEKFRGTKSIPIMIDPNLSSLNYLKPHVLIDATMKKKAGDAAKDLAPVVIGLGPGFEAGEDVHAVVETARGHYLGKVYYTGKAKENTGIPGNVGGYTVERVLRAPRNGIFKPKVYIGDQVETGDVVAEIGGEKIEAKICGIVRGLLMEGIEVKEGMKIGDVDPRAETHHCFSISDKARSIGGGALEAALHFLNTNWWAK